MATGGGVYADIADQSGDYTASITIDRVEYNGIVLNDMAARMETKTSVTTPYLDAIAAAVSVAGAPEGTGGATLPISDMYGYIIDLAFRTNAADSKLLLQATPADRIYTDNTNEETMGHGSTMSFAATTTDFTNEQVKELMRAIRIVFFNPTSKNVIATAKLDVDKAELTADGITAEMYVYKLNDGTPVTTYSAATYTENSGVTYYTKSTQEVYTEISDEAAAAATVQLYTTADNATYTEATYVACSGPYYTKGTKDVYNPVDDAAAAAAAAGTLYTQSVNSTGATRLADTEIMPLAQNTATALSCLVYLDGNKVTNASVAATAPTSMTGKMNLQFSSSANLVPMDYAALYIPSGSNTGTPETTAATTP